MSPPNELPRSVQNVTKTAPSAAVSEPREVPAGPFSEWLRATHRARKLEVIGAEVPCGSCIGCCRASLFIHIRPDETATLARIPKRLLFPAPGLPKGNVLLGHDEQGRCPMLVNERCSIYEDRPQTCRDYDCRVFAASGIDVDQTAAGEIAERVRAWKFSHPTDIDSREHAAVRAAGKFLTEHAAAFLDGALPPNPVQLALLAVRAYELFVRLNDASAAGQPLPAPEQIAQAILPEPEAGAALHQAPKQKNSRHR